MANRAKVSVVIPAHNEAERISDTVKGVVAIPEVSEIIVVDDASSDETAELARQAGAIVISLPNNMGKGGALNTGVARATGDIVALLDGDLGSSSVEARALILPVLNNKADMTIAQFPRAKKKGGFGLVKNLARAGIRHFAGLDSNAPLSGQRVMTRKVLEKVVPFASGYGVEVALTIKVAKEGFRVLEVPTRMSHAETGRDLRGFMHRGKQFVHVARVLAGCFLKYGFTRARNR
ncbi:Glycosyltransferase involved in cell wall bisynthesis [Desulforamulus putei DSM 12395]|uniref:Glucosyl-3-phosphoglycerate synthase n=1 Tax=Desulforamulus putei DSM 12395 TaxID=1121429 RepID=A0A1M5ADS6_9FIRM|nr:glycosyltransferase family 2 protein [Desulforamulus putei]SHF28315.1 Glycosyltransferase involved in cell wall bisynthesis [Desulforamulus putei DSM 12395]